MAEAKILRIYLDPDMRDMAQRGDFGFVSRVTRAFEGEGFRVELRKNSFEERAKSGARHGYSLFLMDDPFHEKALTMRCAYYYPFWRIEPTAKRWEFDVARKRFDPAEIDTDKADEWYRNWRRWLFKGAPDRSLKRAMVYVPLQGRLLEHRSFQSMSPIDMIADVQAHAGERKILLGLHPGERYEPEELQALDALAATDNRIVVQTGDMVEALRTCEMVVTQNSSVALNGFFFEKPAILYGETDFHHAMPQVSQLGSEAAWAAARDKRPAFAEYLYWFIALNAIKADVDGAAEEKILATCRRHGWET